MRQSGVAAFASLMTGLRFDAGQLRRMAGLTSSLIRELPHEVVRHVATLAVHAGMKSLVTACILVTRAALAHPRSQLCAGGVRIVAANARANPAFLRMVRMLFGVATSTSLVGAGHHVVCRVAVGALLMALCVSCAQNRDVFVARSASNCLFFTELVRLVATDARYVPAFEQRAGRHDRLRLFMTGHASLERVGAGTVLLFVTGRAYLVRCLPAQCVGRLHVLVALRAGPGLGSLGLVRLVAVQAFAGVVNLHRRRECLSLTVAVRAIAGLVRVRRLIVGQAFEAANQRIVAEAMTQRAIAFQLHFQSAAGFAGGVADIRLFLMTGRAAQGRDGADLGLTDSVTGAARHLLSNDVHIVPGDGARGLPTGGNVYAAPRMRRLGTVAARASERHCQQEQDGRPARAAPRRGLLVIPHGAAPGRR